jgi:hypothetical protein
MGIWWRMSEQDHERLADQLEREAKDLQKHSDEIAQRAADVRQDWERKRADQSVPGAPPEDGDERSQGGDQHD